MQHGFATEGLEPKGKVERTWEDFQAQSPLWVCCNPLSLQHFCSENTGVLGSVI
jgi:hypothetical protein